MATIRKRKGKNGTKYQAIIRLKGVEKVETFDSEKAAKDWVRQEEGTIVSARRGEIPKGVTFGQLLTVYADEVLVDRPRGVWETNRVNRLIEDFPEFANVELRDLTEDHVNAWIVKRGKQPVLGISGGRTIKASTVQREWSFLSGACTWGRKKKWLKVNPFSNSESLRGIESRNRIGTPEEHAAILFSLGCKPWEAPMTKMQWAGFVYLFALQTGMRSGEICELKWKHIIGNNEVAKLGQERRSDGKRNTKTGTERDVPLWDEARELLEMLPRGKPNDLVFGMEAKHRERLFNMGKQRSGVKDLTFHDARHAALTMMAMPKEMGGRGIDPLTLALIAGHSNVQQLRETYYNPNMLQLARAHSKRTVADEPPRSPYAMTLDLLREMYYPKLSLVA